MAQYKSRQLDRNLKTYEEQLKMDQLFDKIEREMGIEPSSYQTQKIERMVESDMNANYTNSMRRICRGELYYVVPEGEVAQSDRNAPFVGGRPAVIVSNDMNNEMSGLVEVVYLTTHPINNLPTHVTVNATGRKSTAICDQIYTVAKKRIGKYVGQCSIAELNKIDAALALSLGLNFKEKDTAVNILESWRNEMASSYTEQQLNMMDVHDDEMFASKNKQASVPHVDSWVIDIVKEFAGSDALKDKDTFRAYMTNMTSESSDDDSKEQLSKELYELQKEYNRLKLASKSAPSVPSTPVDITTHPEYIKVVAERDVFKELYMKTQA